MNACASGLLALAAALAASPAAAEDLVQVFDLALGRDAGLAAARAQAQAATPRVTQARAALRPSVGANASASWSRYDPSSSEVDPSGERLDTRNGAATLSLRQPIWRRTASIDVDIARKGVELAQAEWDAALQDFVLKVAQAYFDVLTAQEVLVATRASKESLASQLDAATRTYAAGTAVITDKQDAQARFDMAVSLEVAADNDLRVRQLALNRLTGLHRLAPAPLASPLVLPPLNPTGLDDWLVLAGQHPAVARAKAALDSARLDVDKARASRLPTVDVVASYGLNRVSGSGSSISSNLPPGRTQNTTVGVELNIPLFDGGARRGRIDETSLLQQSAAHAAEDAARVASEATERAYFDLASGQAQVKALEAALQSNRSALDGTRLAYRAGVRLNLDVLNSLAQLYDTQRDLARARHELLMRWLKLRAAAGQLKPADLAAVNAMLRR